jgi:hypothetical protein
VNRLAHKLTKLEPAVRDRFAELAVEVGNKARQRDGGHASAEGALPLEGPKQNLVERR